MTPTRDLEAGLSWFWTLRALWCSAVRRVIVKRKDFKLWQNLQIAKRRTILLITSLTVNFRRSTEEKDSSKRPNKWKCCRTSGGNHTCELQEVKDKIQARVVMSIKEDTPWSVYEVLQVSISDTIRASDFGWPQVSHGYDYFLLAYIEVSGSYSHPACRVVFIQYDPAGSRGKRLIST